MRNHTLEVYSIDNNAAQISAGNDEHREFGEFHPGISDVFSGGKAIYLLKRVQFFN